MAGVSAGAVASRIEVIRDRVARQGRDPEAVRIVAVTKGFGVDAVEAAVEAGLCDVGENYAQELVAKAPASPKTARWHFLGPVQRNKVVRLAPIVGTWHALDRPVSASAVAATSPGVEVMLQVNLIGAPDRPGCRPEEIPALVAECRRLPLDLSGLMTVGPPGDVDGTRRCFRWLASAATDLGLRELSMGMSDDLEVAVAEGATTLRLGRAIFGPRPDGVLVRR